MSGGPTSVRVLPSEKLAAPEPSRTDIPGTLRQQARIGTVSDPVIQHARVDGRDVLITRLPTGEPVAFAPECPHQGTDLNQASIFEGKLRCPKHQYLYDLRTGENIFPTCDARPGTLWKLKPGYLPTYRAEEHDDWVWVSTAPNPPPPSYDPDAEKPPPAELRRWEASQLSAAQLGQSEEIRRHRPASIRVKVGEDVELELPTTPLPGHVWLFEIEGGCIEIRGQAFDEGKNVHLLHIAALVPGQAVVRCRYSKPWQKDPLEVRTYIVIVSSA